MPKPKEVMILGAGVVIHNPALIRGKDECDVM